MAKPVYPNREAAKAAGWFSRRHKTDAEHRAAQEARRSLNNDRWRRRVYGRPMTDYLGEGMYTLGSLAS